MPRIMKAVGSLLFIGSLVFAAYFGATDAPAHIQARVLLTAIVALLMMGRDTGERWLSFIFWSVLYAMFAVGFIAMISMWVSRLAGWS
jgi:hypothetical protein